MPSQVFSEEIWRMSPEYQRAFEEGYLTAKREILAAIKKLEPFRTSTGTAEI